MDNLKYLETLKGCHTSLITFSLPAGADKNKAIRKMNDEKASALRIKDSENRSNVLRALSWLIEQISSWITTKSSTNNVGVVFFVGMVQDNDFVCHKLVPPVPLTRQVYFCDKRFRTEYFEQFFDVTKHESIGVVLVSGEDAVFYSVEGTLVRLLEHLTIHRRKNHKKGGQSSKRFNGLRLEQLEMWVKKIAWRFSKHYLSEPEQRPLVKFIALIANGCPEVKDQVFKSQHLCGSIKSMIKVNRVMVASQSNNLITKDILAILDTCDSETKASKGAKLWSHLRTDLVLNGGLYAYGLEAIDTALQQRLVHRLVIAASEIENLFRKRPLWKCHESLIEKIEAGDTAFVAGYGGAIAVLHYALDSADAVDAPDAVDDDVDKLDIPGILVPLAVEQKKVMELMPSKPLTDEKKHIIEERSPRKMKALIPKKSKPQLWTPHK